VTIIARVVQALLVLAGAILGGVPSEASASPPCHPGVHAYGYDAPFGLAVGCNVSTDRGPPVEATHVQRPHLADDHGFVGVLARPGRATTTNYYDRPAASASGCGAGTHQVRVGRPAGTSPSVERGGVAANSADEFVDLASASRRSHILDGEVRPNGSFGGGHRPGTGFPNKSEFPAGCPDDKIMHSISDIATDPSLIWRAGNKPGDFFVNGTRGGIDIEVLIRNNQIWTGYPTNVIRNAP